MKDKELTKRRLIEAVGVIIKKNGINAVKISKVAREAQVDRKLIYRYFGNLNYLIEAYIAEYDYWMLFADQLKILLNDLDGDNSKALITSILQELFKFFFQEKDMQDIILMELSGTAPMMHSIHNFREHLGEGILEKTDIHFENSNVKFRAVAGLLVGGIYYIVLHTRSNGFNFAGINLNSEDGINAVSETLAKIVEWAFAEANK